MGMSNLQKRPEQNSLPGHYSFFINLSTISFELTSYSDTTYGAYKRLIYRFQAELDCLLVLKTLILLFFTESS